MEISGRSFSKGNKNEEKWLSKNIFLKKGSEIPLPEAVPGLGTRE